MIKIFIPNNNIKEREYIIGLVFNDFLGLKYKIVIDDNLQDWKIKLMNESILVFKDSFFNKFKHDLEYLRINNIPNEITYAKSDFTCEKNIPVIYGKSIPDVKDTTTLISSIDLFASVFFMLTRWEEYVNKTRDIHNRFPATESLSYKHNFLDRPIVNEYLELLKNMLYYLDKSLVFKKYEARIFLTHDVDTLSYYPSPLKVIKTCVADIIKRKNIKLSTKRLKDYFIFKQSTLSDPFDTFDWLMDKSESLNIKSRFYFMSGGTTSYDNAYKINGKKSLNLMKKIKNRGHYIGIHPSYNAYNNGIQFEKELKKLQDTIGLNIKEGREHYLRFEVPTTWQIWDDNSMDMDSTCGYADKEGFRCGVCYEFSVFNILTRKKLRLKERPLIVMEGTLLEYQEGMTSIKMEDIILNLVQKVKKYNGDFVFLWHNSSFNTENWKNHQQVYENVLLKC